MNNKLIGIALIIGIAIGAVGVWIAVSILDSKDSTASNTQDNAPLYWVAPMDPNFKREQPGKSPMGMDLVPVYKTLDETSQGSPGTVTIAPSVINNLGVTTTVANTKALQSTILTVGSLGYNQDTLVHIHPRMEGWIDTLYVKATGEYVKQGQALYSLYSPELVSAQEEFIMALQRQNKALISASQARLNALQVPKNVIDELRKTRTVKQQITFYSPQTGFVDMLSIREGFYVKPDTTLMAIGAVDEVWVEADVFARHASMLKLDNEVQITLDYFPGQVWTGKINHIYPSLDLESRTIKARIRVANPNYLLKPGMFANLKISGEEMAASIVLPIQSVIRTGSQDRVVLALDEGAFKSVAVTVGAVQGDEIQILSGLQEGDRIVSSAQFLIDSQSSISSDFLRMTSKTEANANQQPESVWTHATIIEVMQQERMLTLDHGPLDDWGMPAMMMDFMLADDIDMDNLTPGMDIHIQLGKTMSGMFEVLVIHDQMEMQDNDMSSKEDPHQGHSQ